MLLAEEENPTEKAPLILFSKTTRVEKCDIFCKSLLFTLCSLVFCVLIIGVAALLTCYLVILPITNGFSNLFDRLSLTFHVDIAIVSALVYAMYKIFFEKKNDSHNESKEEKSTKRKEKDSRSKKEEKISIEKKKKGNSHGLKARESPPRHKEIDSAC